MMLGLVALIIPIAHAGHWLASLLYLVPVALLGGGIGYQRMMDRRTARERADPGEEGAEDSET